MLEKQRPRVADVKRFSLCAYAASDSKGSKSW